MGRGKTKPEIAHVHCVRGLICSLSSVDQERNNISLFNVIEQISVSKDFFLEQVKHSKNGNHLLFPIQIEIVLLLRRVLQLAISEGEISTDLKLTLIDPRGQNVQTLILPVLLKKDKRRAHVRIKIDSLPFTVPGDYFYKVEVRVVGKNDFEDTNAVIPLEVVER